MPDKSNVNRPGNKHARPPEMMRIVDSEPPRRRRRRVVLPEDDPFVLLDMVDELGGVSGEGKPMRPVAASAFRRFCMMPPTHRSLARLAATLELEWGKAPNRKSLETWSAQHKWQTLVKQYDLALDRYRLLQLETDRDEARKRHAKTARAMIAMASQTMHEDITGNDVRGNPLPPEIDPATGRPRKRPNRLQALAFTVKVGIEAERLALGLPSVVTDQRVQADVNQTTTSVSMTLDEWRQQSRLARIDDDDDDRAVQSLGPSPHEGQRALPDPSNPSTRVARVIEHLSGDESDDLPDGWFDTSESRENASQRVSTQDDDEQNVVEGSVEP